MALPSPGVDDPVFVFHIVILSFFALFALFSLPRLLLRFSHPSEWFSGLFLLSAASQKHIPQSHTRPPIHVSHKHWPSPPLLTFSNQFHTASAVFRRDLGGGHTIGQLLVVFGYFCIILYAGIYHGDPFAFWIREGLITMVQVPIVFALATKNNVLGTLLAVGYEKLNWLHRFLGRFMAVIAAVHALGFIYVWSLNGSISQRIREPQPIHGLMAFTGLNLLAWFSTSFFREHYYRIFLTTHIAGFVLFPIGLALHTPIAIPYVAAGVGLYLLDHILRILRSRITGATLVAVPELGLTRIEIPRLNSGWRPGQHVRVRVISSGLGLFGWSEAHPFTIAGVHNDGMLLMCKKSGDWTNRLFLLAQKAGGSEKGVSGTVTIILEGPYGGVGHTMMHSFSGALFISGGSGITFSLGAIQDLIAKDVENKSRVRVIELVWTVQNAESYIPMLPLFNAFIQAATSVKIHISIHYTRAASKTHGMTPWDVPPQISVTPGRPQLSRVIAKMIDDTVAFSAKPTGLFVGICGPVGLGRSVQDAVGSVDSVLRRHIGGMEVCEETFAF